MLALRNSWRSGLAWAAVFAISSAAVVSAYESAYPTAISRQELAMVIEGNRAFEALFGQAFAIETVGGFAAWRAGGPLNVIAAVAGLLATTRLLRGEEEARRWEIVSAGAITRPRATAATLVGYTTVLLGVLATTALALVAVGLEAKGSFLIAASAILTGFVFAAVGAVTSQLVPTRRGAAALGGAVLATALLMRVLADGTDSLGPLRNWTPFGWANLVRAFSGSRLEWLAPLVAIALILAAIAVTLSGRRDLESGWFLDTDTRRSTELFLGSAEGLALRSSIRAAITWAISVGVFAAVMGALSVDIAEFAARSAGIRRLVSQLGAVDLAEPAGFLGLAFSVFLVLPVSLAAVFRMAIVREEEASGRLDLLLSGNVRRSAWLAAWAIVALGTAAAVGVCAGLAAWATSSARGADLSITQGIASGLNAVPPAAVFVGLGALAFALIPRRAVAVSLGAVAVAMLIQIVGSLGDLPAWVVDLSPFSHPAPVPATDIDLTSAAVLVGIGTVLTLVGLAMFARRDVAGA
jgi:ABC-2 type transport system permease protein